MHRMALPQITWQDVQQLPDDGNRYEAIEGDLYVTAAPSFRHQRISLRLSVALHRLLEEPGTSYFSAITRPPKVSSKLPGTVIM